MSDLKELFTPFTPEAIEALNDPEIIWNGPLSIGLRNSFRELQSYIMELYRSSEIGLRSVQQEPTVIAVMEEFEKVRKAIGIVDTSNNDRVIHTVEDPIWKKLIR